MNDDVETAAEPEPAPEQPRPVRAHDVAALIPKIIA